MRDKVDDLACRSRGPPTSTSVQVEAFGCGSDLKKVRQRRKESVVSSPFASLRECSRGLNR